MAQFYEITDHGPPQNPNRLGYGELMKLVFSLQPGQGFLSPNQASGTLKLVKKHNPERVYHQRRDKETGGTWIVRGEDNKA